MTRLRLALIFGLRMSAITYSSGVPAWWPGCWWRAWCGRWPHSSEPTQAPRHPKWRGAQPKGTIVTDPNTTPADEQTATLLVDRTSSTCGACGRPTLPSARTHANVSGYEPKPGGGCGARFVAIRSVNRSVTEGHLRSLRPDLPADTGREQQMTTTPYADSDLRAEAARLHALSSADPDEGLVGELMERGYVPSVETSEDGSARTWAELLEPDGEETPEYEDAQSAVTELIKRAANTSRWAVDLGADGLEPDEHSITIGEPGDLAVRVHFAFNPSLDDGQRAELVRIVASHMGT